MKKSIFYRGRRPKLTGCPLVDLARLPVKPEVLARFVYCPSKTPDQAAVGRFLDEVLNRLHRLKAGATTI